MSGTQRGHRLDKHCALMQKLQRLNLDDADHVDDVRKKLHSTTHIFA